MFLAPTYRISEDSVPNIESEVQRHIPFYIQPYNDFDPYVGDYESLIAKFGIDPGARSLRQAIVVTTTTTETSLNSNEFTDMPPKEPKN